MIVESVLEFRRKFGLVIPDEPTGFVPSDMIYGHGCLKEEVHEFETHMDTALIDPRVEDSEGMLDALVDLVYFAVGIAIKNGWDFEEAFRRVHVANMCKELAGDTPNKRQSPTDIIKPDGWTAASLRDLVKPSVTTVGEELCDVNGSSSVVNPLSEPTIFSLPAIVRSSEDLRGHLNTG